MSTIITRAEWGARPPTRITPLNVPVALAITHHGASAAAPARAQWQGYQRFHMDVRKWSDIAYNEGVDNATGDIYEGRGLDRAGGATGAPWDARSLSWCWIGNYQTDRPTDGALEAYAQRLAEVVRLGKLTVDFTLSGHRDHTPPGKPTACCGDNLYRRLPDVRRRVSDILANDNQGEDMLTVAQVRSGHNRPGAEEFAREALTELGFLRGPHLDRAVIRAKAAWFPRATDQDGVIRAAFWRRMIAEVSDACPEAIHTEIPPANCSAVEAELAKARGMIATQATMIAAARDALG